MRPVRISILRWHFGRQLEMLHVNMQPTATCRSGFDLSTVTPFCGVASYEERMFEV